MLWPSSAPLPDAVVGTDTNNQRQKDVAVDGDVHPRPLVGLTETSVRR